MTVLDSQDVKRIQEDESTDKGDGETQSIKPKARLDNGIQFWAKSREAGRILVADSMLHTRQQRTNRISRQYRKMVHILEGNHIKTQGTLLLSRRHPIVRIFLCAGFGKQALIII